MYIGELLNEESSAEIKVFQNPVTICWYIPTELQGTSNLKMVNLHEKGDGSGAKENEEKDAQGEGSYKDRNKDIFKDKNSQRNSSVEDRRINKNNSVIDTDKDYNVDIIYKGDVNRDNKTNIQSSQNGKGNGKKEQSFEIFGIKFSNEIFGMCYIHWIILLLTLVIGITWSADYKTHYQKLLEKQKKSTK